jgi:hypothetical protein
MIHIICVAYERIIPLRILIDCFLIQTDPRWKLHIIYDGLPPKDIMDLIKSYEYHPFNKGSIDFTWSKERNQNFGHPNRKYMLENLKGNPEDFVLMTNDDNIYIPVFVEYMLNAVKNNIGIVSCNTIHSHFQYNVHESKLFECGIDMGAFIVKYSIAKKVGFNHNHHSADGRYAVECANACHIANLETIHIPKCLFIHN